MARTRELQSRHEVRLFRLSRAQDVAERLEEHPIVLGVAYTSISDEVRAKYHRDRDESDVWADVRVECDHPLYRLEGVVYVRITYAGDMVRSTPSQRARANTRLQQIAQAVSLEQLQREMMPGRTAASARLPARRGRGTGRRKRKH